MAKTVHSSKKRLSKTTHKAFSEHINELRGRVMWVALVFIVTSAVAYNYRDFLVHLVLSPLGDQKLVYLTPAGGFSFIFQITMYAGAVITAPLIIYHLYKFVVPALPEHAHKHSFKVILSATLLMIAGVCFGYYVAVPSALHFLTQFAGSYIEANLTADSYLSFVLAYVAGLGVLFQLPLLLVFWNWMNPMSPGKLLSSERFIVVFAFIAAAIMTPTPDVMNQALIAIPIIGIYQLGVISVFFANRSKARKARKAAARASIPSMISPAPLPDSVFQALIESEQQITTQQPRLVKSQPVSPQGTKIAVKSMDGFVVSKPQSLRPEPRPLLPPARPEPPRSRGAVRPGLRSMSLDGISLVNH